MVLPSGDTVSPSSAAAVRVICLVEPYSPVVAKTSPRLMRAISSQSSDIAISSTLARRRSEVRLMLSLRMLMFTLAGSEPGVRV